METLFSNAKVLVTGHTGFKGSWLSAWLGQLGAEVSGIALDPPTSPSHFIEARLADSLQDHRLDIRNSEALGKLVHSIQPDFVFHLAAQPLVRLAYHTPIETYQTNTLGTLHMLEALRTLENPCTAVFITSDKVYRNVEWPWGYRETDPLGGADPYSASKAAAELIIRSHVESFFPRSGSKRIAIGRAGNVIGGGDWARDRIVPDTVRARTKDQPVVLRNPSSTRPWQHVLEPLDGYLQLAAALHQNPKLHGEPFNFGPPAHQNHTVSEVVESMADYWPGIGWTLAENATAEPRESGLLKLNCDKALHELGWQPTLSFSDSVRLTTEWYRSYHENPQSIRPITENQLQEYTSLKATETPTCK